MKIGIIGAGNVARHLGALFLRSGHDVALGQRSDAKPEPEASYRSMSLGQVVAHGDVIVLAVPFGALTSVLPPLARALAGKVVVDATNPVQADWSPQILGAENSAGEEVARLLPEARVVKAFNTVFADVMTPERLVRAGQRVTAFVAGDHPSANDIVASLAADAGFAPLIVGVLAEARHLEAVAHLNICDCRRAGRRHERGVRLPPGGELTCHASA